MIYDDAECGDGHNMTASPLDETLRPGSDYNLDFINLDARAFCWSNPQSRDHGKPIEGRIHGPKKQQLQEGDPQ
jgi:hypothetical protein